MTRPRVSGDDRSGTARARPAEALTAAVAAYEGRMKFRALAARLLLWLAVGLSTPLAVVWADHTWFGGLPRGALNGALLVWGVGLGGTLLAVLLITLARRLNPVFVGRQLERISRIRHNSVVNALLVRQTASLTYAGEAAAGQAAYDLATHEPAETPRTGHGRVPLIALGAAGGIWALYLFLSPKPIGPSLARFFGVDRPAPTATWLERRRPRADEVVHAGEALTFEFAVHGQPVQDVQLQILDPDDPDGLPRRRYVSNVQLGAETDLRRFVLPPLEVWDDVHYRCLAADARLEGTIDVKPQPAIADLEITLEPPAYTGWPARVAAEPDLNVLVGTRAMLRVRANTPIRDPLFVLVGGGETRTRMRIDPADPHSATLTLLLVESGTYHFEFSDPWAAPHRDPPTYQLDVRGDVPPTVEITTPQLAELSENTVSVARFPNLVALGQDDVAVESGVLVVERADGVRRTPIELAAGPSTRIRSNLVALPHEPGERARAWIEVQDGRVMLDGRPAPQTARSTVITVVWPVSEPLRTPAGEGAEVPDGDSDGEEGSGAGDDGEETPAEDDGTAPVDGGETDSPDTPDAEAGDGAGEAESDSEGVSEDETSEAERKLREFVRKHGEEASEIAKRLRGGEQQGDSESDDAAEQPPEGEPKESKPKDDETKPSEDGSSKPQTPPESEPQEAEKPAEDASAGKTDPSEDEVEPDQRDEPVKPEESDPDEASEPTSPPKEGAQAGPAKPSESESEKSESGGDAGEPQTGQKPDDVAPEPSNPQFGPGSPGESTTDGPRSHDRPLDGDDWDAVTGDIAELLKRADELTEEGLVQAGWSPNDARAFLEALRELNDALEAAGGLANLPRIAVDVRIGEATRQAGGEVAGDVQRRADPVEARRKGLRRIAPPAEQQIDANLRRLLEAYYRTMAAQREQAERTSD